MISYSFDVCDNVELPLSESNTTDLAAKYQARYQLECRDRRLTSSVLTLTERSSGLMDVATGVKLCYNRKLTVVGYGGCGVGEAYSQTAELRYAKWRVVLTVATRWRC